MKKQKSLLDRVSIEKPCTADWDKMFGTDEVRFCEHCAKSVHNLSSMTRERAERLVRKSNGNLCIRYYTSKNKKILVKDAPVQITRLGRRVSQLAASVFTAALSVSAVAAQGGARIAPVSSTEIKQTQTETKLNLQNGSFGVLSGIIKDPQGAVVPNVTVTLFDEDNNIVATIASSDEGLYSFKSLAEGVYKLQFTATAGFSKHRVENVQISTGNETTVDADLILSGEAVTMGVVGTVSPLVDWIYHSEKRTKIEAEPTEQTLEFFNKVISDDFDEVKNALRAGIFVDVQMPDGATPLMYADSPKMAKFLIRRGANVHAQNMYGETALMVPVRNAKMIEFLLSAGLDVNATSSFGVTPLMYAMGKTEVESVQMLLKAGANPNASDIEGRTALIFAVYEGELEIIKLLVEAGADVNASDRAGKTVLMYAVAGDDEENLTFLIENGADINARDAEGKSVLKYALEDEAEEAIEYLKSLGALE